MKVIENTNQVKVNTKWDHFNQNIAITHLDRIESNKLKKG